VVADQVSEPRKYSDVKAERAEHDPERRRRIQVIDEIKRLESMAQATGDKSIQCEAEELRTMLYHDYFVPEKMA
jgi:hypothetical protein